MVLSKDIILKLLPNQIQVMEKIRIAAQAVSIDPVWAAAVALKESSLGINQLSPTGCKGVFQMSTIAMKDLLLEMEKRDDDLIDIYCGVLFLRLLLKRHKTIPKATARFCDPADRATYVPDVLRFMEELT